MTIEIVDFPINSMVIVHSFIVDFPIKKMVIFHRFLYVYQRALPSPSCGSDVPSTTTLW